MSDYLQIQFGLAGRRAVVTGGSRGIGRAIAEALSAAGAEVLVHYHQNSGAAGEVVKRITDTGGRAWSHAADLCDPSSAAALFEAIAKTMGRVGCVGQQRRRHGGTFKAGRIKR